MTSTAATQKRNRPTGGIDGRIAAAGADRIERDVEDGREQAFSTAGASAQTTAYVEGALSEAGASGGVALPSVGAGARECLLPVVSCRRHAAPTVARWQ